MNQDLYYNLEQAYKNRAASKDEILQMYRDIEDKDLAYPNHSSNTLAHLAAQYADADAIRLLMESGATINVLNSYNYTPLRVLCDSVNNIHKPSYNDIYNATIALLDAKVSVLRKDDSGNLCYHIAANNGVYPIIQAFIERGVKLSMTDNNGFTALHTACEAVRHTITGIPYTEDNLRKRKEELEQPAASETWEKLRRESYEEAVKKLEEEQALLEDYFKIVKALVDAGIDPDEKNNYGNTALDYAVKSNAKKIAAFLKGEYDETNPDSIATGGMTLHQAAEKGDIDAIKAIAARGDDINEVCTEYEYEGKTPLAVACCQKNAAVVQALLDAGADPNFKAGDKGHTAFYYLIHNSSINNSYLYEDKSIQQMIKGMKAAGLNVNDSIDDEANTALIEICRILRYNLDKYNSFDAVVFNMLISFGCNVNLANNNGQTPLMLLADKDEAIENSIITLLENEAKVDVCDKNGNTPLMYAAGNRSQSAAKNNIDIMAEFGDLKINAVNNNGKTALEIATENNHEAVVKQLLVMA